MLGWGGGCTWATGLLLLGWGMLPMLLGLMHDRCSACEEVLASAFSSEMDGSTDCQATLQQHCLARACLFTTEGGGERLVCGRSPNVLAGALLRLLWLLHGCCRPALHLEWGWSAHLQQLKDRGSWWGTQRVAAA